MDFLTQKDLKMLATEHKEICVSITMPAEILVGGNLKNRTKFRVLLEQAENGLENTRLTKDKIRKLLKPAVDCLNDDSFWQDQFDSLVAYISFEEIYLYKLPIVTDENVYISHFFNLIPLIDYFSGNENYYLLLLDEGRTRFFEGDKYQLKDKTTEAIKSVNIESLMDNYESKKRINKCTIGWT